MPRYFFNVRDGKDLPDLHGHVFQDDTSAEREAVIASGEMLTDLGGEFWNHGEWIMTVVDETGRKVCSLAFQGLRP